MRRWTVERDAVILTFGQHDPDDPEGCDLWDPVPTARTPTRAAIHPALRRSETAAEQGGLFDLG